MNAETILLWVLSVCGATIAWSAMVAENWLSSGSPTSSADRIGWSMTGVIGLWAFLQPFLDQRIPVSLPIVVMALSLAIQSWRLSHGYRRSADVCGTDQDGCEPRGCDTSRPVDGRGG